MRKTLLSLNVALFTAVTAITVSLPVAQASASEIKYVVNGTAVTNFDIQHRVAFLKLQRKKGNLSKLAADEMVDQALRQNEIKRLGVRVPDDAVNQAYARFAKSNKMTPKQLSTVMDQAGRTPSSISRNISALRWVGTRRCRPATSRKAAS